MDGLNIYDRFDCGHTHMYSEIVLILPTIDLWIELFVKSLKERRNCGFDSSLRKKYI